MPLRRYRRGRKRKRVYRRKRYTRRPRRFNRISRWGGISLESTFRKAVKFRFVTHVKLDASAAPAVVQYRANSPYDPEYAIGGSSVLKWSYYQNLYKRYICVASRMKVTTLGENAPDVANPSYPGVLTLYLSHDATGLTTWENYIAQGRGAYILTSGNPGAYTKKTMSCRFSAKKFFNIKDVKDNFIDFGCDTNANPPADAYYILTQEGMQTAANPQAVNCLVVIDYWCIFSEPLNTFTF